MIAGWNGNKVEVWDPHSGQLLQTLPTHTAYVTSVAFSPQSDVLAAGTSDNSIIRWNPHTGDSLDRLTAPSQVNAVTYSPDGRLLAAATDGGVVMLLDGVSGRRISSFSVGQSVDHMAFSHDGSMLGVSNGSGRVLLKNLSLGATRWITAVTVPHNSRSNPQVYVAFSPSAPLVATGSDAGHLTLWDYTTGRLLRAEPHASGLAGVAFSPDGTTIVTEDSSSRISLWNTKTELALGQSENFSGPQVLATAFSPDGRLLAVGRDDGTINVLDASNDKVLWHVRSASQRGQGVETLAFRPDSQVLASAGQDQAIRLWSARTGQSLGGVATRGMVTQVAFSPDGGRLAAGVDTDVDVGTLMTLSGATAAPLRALHLHAGAYGLAWLKAGRLAATTGSGPLVWDPTSGTVSHPIPGNGNAMSITASPDGSILAMLNNAASLTLWDTTKWTQLESLGAAGDDDFAFTRDGRTIAAAGASGNVQMWNVASGQQLGANFRVPQRLPNVPQQPTGVNTLAFSPDESKLIMGTSDGTLVELNSLPLGNPQVTARYMCRVVCRNLTTSEWHQLIPGTPYHAACADYGYR